MKKPSILIIDSGVGGLSIAQEIRAHVESAHITYIADTEKHPYGPKPEPEISQRVTALVEYGIKLFDPDIVVIACNTASTLVLTQLRDLFSIPFIGVVPAIKPAAQVTQSGVIGVLATQATVNRAYTSKLIADFAQNTEVHLHGSAKLVAISEQKLQGITVCQNTIKEEVQKLLRQSIDIDTVVLACTHFPIIKADLARCFPHISRWVDSGEAVARRVEYWLSQLKDEPRERPTNSEVNHFICTSTMPPYLESHIRAYLGTHTTRKISL